MILRSEGGRTRIVMQTDHARLCGEFAAAWGGERFRAPEPLAAVRLAADMHDHGWLDWEQAPQVRPESGRPMDFLSLPTDTHVELYGRGIEQVVGEHPYAGLLVSLHGAGLYKKRYGHMPDLVFKEVAHAYRTVVDQYLAEQEALQATLLAELRPNEQAVWTHYRWLQAWDLLSLFLCLSEPRERGRLTLGVMPLYPGGPEERLEVQGAGPGRFVVSPWPFATDVLELIVPVRYITDRVYGSDAELQAALAAAPTEPLRVTLGQ